MYFLLFGRCDRKPSVQENEELSRYYIEIYTEQAPSFEFYITVLQYYVED